MPPGCGEASSYDAADAAKPDDCDIQALRTWHWHLDLMLRRAGLPRDWRRAFYIARIDFTVASVAAATSVVPRALLIVAGITMTAVAGRGAAVRSGSRAAAGERAEIAAGLALRPACCGRAQ